MGRESDADVRWEQRLRSLGLAMMTLEKYATAHPETAGCLLEVRFKLDADEGTGVLAILKATEGDNRRVAFIGGYDLSTVCLSVAKRLRNGSVKWREDRPWQA